MLTRAQIQRLAQRHRIGMQVQERDYLQHLLLSLLYTRSQALIFKGGTALRLVYHDNRYSEDLDFNGPNDVDSSEYDDVRPFVVTVLTPEHVLAEKVRALLMRSKPRDLYDIWLLLNQGVAPDRALITRKLELYETAFSPQAVEEAVARVRADWERDLRPLLAQFVTYEDVVTDVLERLVEPYE